VATALPKPAGAKVFGFFFSKKNRFACLSLDMAVMR
jgi:hypothetical protein